MYICFQALRMVKMDHFFASVASLMSNLLRSCVTNSIYDLVKLVEEYYEGNKYDGTYNIFQGLALPQKIHLVHFFMVRNFQKLKAPKKVYTCLYVMVRSLTVEI